MVGSPKPFEGLHLLEPEPPVPLTAVLDQGAATFTITFDRPLQNPLPASVAAGLRIGDTRLTYLDWAVSPGGDGIVGMFADASADPGPNMAWMDVPPTGVRSLTGEPASAFSDFPLTIV